jgi:hypothetical protein
MFTRFPLAATVFRGHIDSSTPPVPDGDDTARILTTTEYPVSPIADRSAGKGIGMSANCGDTDRRRNQPFSTQLKSARAEHLEV